MDSKGWPTAPNPGGIPDPIPQVDTLIEVVQDATWRALGKPAQQRIYTSIQGDWWDLIAIRVYGRKRGNEHLMYRLIEENYALREVAQFPAGIPVFVPEIDVDTEIPLVPWKKATIIT
jgi:phage tail protein X